MARARAPGDPGAGEDEQGDDHQQLGDQLKVSSTTCLAVISRSTTMSITARAPPRSLLLRRGRRRASTPAPAAGWRAARRSPSSPPARARRRRRRRASMRTARGTARPRRGEEREGEREEAPPARCAPAPLWSRASRTASTVPESRSADEPNAATFRSSRTANAPTGRSVNACSAPSTPRAETYTPRASAARRGLGDPNDLLHRAPRTGAALRVTRPAEEGADNSTIATNAAANRVKTAASVTSSPRTLWSPPVVPALRPETAGRGLPGLEGAHDLPQLDQLEILGAVEPGAEFAPSWQTKRPVGNRRPSGSATASMPSVCEQRSACGPAATVNDPTKARLSCVVGREGVIALREAIR